MSNREEQCQEVEALESIFPSEIEIIETEPFHKLRFTIKSENYDKDPDNEAKIVLSFTFNEAYPNDVPGFEIEESENLSDEQDALDFLTSTAKENLGMPMIYTLISDLVEKLNKDNDQRKEDEANEKERCEREKEAEELKRFEGTKVTVESFLRWKVDFDKEMSELRRQKEEKAVKKTTGKQLFERDEKLFESDLQLLNEEAVVEVDESLFQNLDDLDLDDDGEEYVPGDDDDDDDDDDDYEEE